MSEAELREVGELFEAALALPEADRAAWLDAACADRPDLRSEVASLLDLHEPAAAWFDRLALDLEGTALRRLEGALGEDRRIGRWRTLERIGRGGMGSVYRAERADGHFDQRVALKIIHRGMESPAVVDRFVAEREILARLEHPNVARLVDGGLTDEGLPWLAMELVQGARIDEFCDAAALGLAERLELFLQVADAVAWLHRHLVVHRDLKPANVLVTDAGVVKVVDFGIAKLLEDGDPGMTSTGSRPRTPRYAAPEQITGDPVSTATDVHALGVLLYELLAGRPPFEGEGHALEREILEKDPEPPSAAVQGRDAKALRGDLDTIVLTALRKRPERRYGSAEAMADDIRRHMGGRPVRARPDSLGYRVGKLLRRNRVAVAATAAVVVLSVSFGIYASVQAARLAEERDRARESFSLLVDVFSAADPVVSPGEVPTARDVVDASAARVRERLRDRPVLRGELLGVLGRTYRNLGLFDDAVALHRESLASLAFALPDDAPELAEARYQLGEALIETADYEEARGHLETALRMQERATDPDGPDVARTLNDLARATDGLGDAGEALRLHDRALSIRRTEADPAGLSQSLHNTGSLLSRLGRNAEAVPMLQEAVDLRTAAFGDLHPRTQTSMNALAVTLERAGRLAEAEVIYRDVLDAQHRLHPGGHSDVAIVLGNLANLVLARGGSAEEAEAMHREALAIERDARGEDHPVVGQRYHTLARAVHAAGRLQEAEELFGRALDILTSALPADHPNLAYPLTELGRVRIDDGRPAEALPGLERALRLRTASLPEGHRRTAETRIVLGRALAALGRVEEARDALRTAHEALRDDPGAAGLAERAAALLAELDDPPAAAESPTPRPPPPGGAPAGGS